MIKPKNLKKGDTIAVVSPSYGAPGDFPKVFNEGIKQLEQFGFKVKVMPFANASSDDVYNNPQLRAKDINDAFADSEINGIICSIGGDDSIRILKYLDDNLIRNNPKFFMGYSDSTAITTRLAALGLVSFNGPAVMAGWNLMREFNDSYMSYLNTFFFGVWDSLFFPKLESYANGNTSWDSIPVLLKDVKEYAGPICLQGTGKVTGELWGGCFEVLEFLKGTRYWPDESFWNNKILFFECSGDDSPGVDQVGWWLRNLGVQDVFGKISGLAIGLFNHFDADTVLKVHDEIKKILKEFGATNLPVLVDVQFGHIYPQMILPLGVNAKIDCEEKTLTLIENPFK